MAVPGRRNGEEEENEEVALFEAGDGEDAWSDELDDDRPPQIRALADAAQRGDLDALRVALDNHTGSIDEPVEDGDTLLHLCCLYGHLSCVELLTERGASLESKDEEGALPLHDACAGGFIEIVKHIFTSAGTPDRIEQMLTTIDAEGDTPLHHAARGEHLNVVKLLLANGASPNKTNIYGKTPAELADEDTEVRSVLAEAAASAGASE